MTDIADNADKFIEMQRQSQIDAAREAAKQQTPGGACRNCGEELDPWDTFCDTDCRDDFDARQRLQGRR